MITGIQIENFKGIGERVSLDFRPITLLFGANSAGKSTILHALQYMRDVLERRNLDPDTTTGTGDCIDFGGFAQVVHGKSFSKSISIRVACRTAPISIDGSDPLEGIVEYPHLDVFLATDRLMTTEFQRLVAIEEPGIEVEITQSDQFNAPYVSRLTVFEDGRRLASITSDPLGRRVVLSVDREFRSDSMADWYRGHFDDLNDGEVLDEQPLYDELSYDPEEPLLHLLLSRFDDLVETDGESGVFVKGLKDALVGPHDQLQFEWKPDDSRLRISDELISEFDFFREMTRALSSMIVARVRHVFSDLKEMRYLGPIRERPPRDFRPARFPNPSRWASGLGAWDVLAADLDTDLIEITSAWLSRLSTEKSSDVPSDGRPHEPPRPEGGYFLYNKSFRRVDMSDPLMMKIMTGRAFDEADADERHAIDRYLAESELVIQRVGSEIQLKPSDLGIGISQVIPVIVTALDGNERLLSIEQPELHLHPRVQAELGDLFIEAAHLHQNKFLLETHSEHLILRLLRRIRETEAGKAPANRELRTDELAIYYLKQEEGTTRAQRIDVDVKGEFIQPWPDDFFEIDFYERFA